MALTATYDAQLSRIRLSATALGPSATRCVFWRTINNFATYDTLRGGWPVPVTAETASIDDYEWPPGVPVLYRVQSYTDANLTPVATFDVVVNQDLDRVWVKIVARPFLNRPVIVYDVSEVGQPARDGVFGIVGRSFPIAISDVRGSPQYTLQLLTETPAEKRDLALMLASGEPIFLHVPSTETLVDGGYFRVGNTSAVRTGRRSNRRVFELPLTQIAAPGPDVVGAAGTWATVLATYPTWADVLAAEATWADLLELVGDPSEVIVP